MDANRRRLSGIFCRQSEGFVRPVEEDRVLGPELLELFMKRAFTA